uniref:Dynein assembly factor 1, axonemal homolog n=1 Tax=Haptolina brevifila TaxID=156173 RepID=A0A7S2JR09_9EUKA|mmetsp:Transcript_86738/g.173110  ORF Transcript_86738/g.173110 Transcript_86738/m.173110 type:complete len:501 (+) Transcript_86738:103-1605(+)
MGAAPRDPRETYRTRAEEEEDDDEEQQVGKRKRVTAKVLKGLIKEQSLYKTASLNDKLYLHYGGYDRIEGLDEWTGLRALWLEGNGFDKIQGLNQLTGLRCIYLQQNCIKRIEGLECCPLLAQVNLSNNFIATIEGLSSLRYLTTLQIANNHLTTADDLTHLLEVPTINVLDLQNNRLEEPEVLDVLEAMPGLAVTQLQGNSFLTKITQYRRNTVYRCRALSYLDDRPVFQEERLAVDAWAIGGLPGEREERRRQREEKDTAHRRNLEYMMSFSGKKRVEVAEGENENSEKDEIDWAKRQADLLAEEKMTEKQMYERALGAVERKRAELLRLKAARQAVEAGMSAEEHPAGADDQGAEADETPGATQRVAGVAAGQSTSAALFADKSAESIVSALEAGSVEGIGNINFGEGSAAAPPASFEAVAAWDGPREGKVYKRGEYGNGYYEDHDAAATSPAAASPAAALPSAAPLPPAPLPPAPLPSGIAQASGVGEVDDLDELD